jgi:D-alanyl-D-alanine carboxypeptidase
VVGFVLALVFIQSNAVFASENDADASKGFPTFSNFVYQPENALQVNTRSFRAGLLYDVENKKIVWQKEMNSVLPIASLTKMMVALLTVEDVHAGKMHWDDKVEWARDVIIKSGRRNIHSSSPASYTLYDLFKAAMIASNNEAAEQMARYLSGGNLDISIQRMNERARELGMNSTYYGNPTGLPAAKRKYDNSSSPTDLLLLCLEMLKYNEITEVTGMDYANIYNGSSTSIISNHNHLAIDFKGEVDGMKTGYTKRAGFCLVATSNKCDHRLVSIVLGAPAPITRNDVVKNMFNDYYSSIGLDRLAPYVGASYYTSSDSEEENVNSQEGEYVYRPKEIIQVHVVKRGEKLSSIAGKYSCTTSEIRKWNHLRSSGVRAGQRLLVKSTIQEKVWVTNQPEDSSTTVSEKTTAQPDENSVSKDVKPAKENFIYHTVQPGDTLFKISQHYHGISVEDLKAANDISNSRALKPGMKLKVPVKG